MGKGFLALRGIRTTDGLANTTPGETPKLANTIADSRDLKELRLQPKSEKEIGRVT